METSGISCKTSHDERKSAEYDRGLGQARKTEGPLIALGLRWT